SWLFAPLPLVERTRCCCCGYLPARAFSVALLRGHGLLASVRLWTPRLFMLLRKPTTGGTGPSHSLDHLQPEQGGDITVIKHLRCGRYCFFQRKFLSGICEQLIFIDTA